MLGVAYLTYTKGEDISSTHIDGLKPYPRSAQRRSVSDLPGEFTHIGVQLPKAL
jgi:hypothetical protein